MKRWFSFSEQLVNGSRLLRLYSYYSLLLALVLVVLTVLDTNHLYVGRDYPTLMLASSATLVVLAALFTVIAYRQPDPQLATGYIFIEVALLSCMMLASGGLGTGFSNLIILPLVVSNLLTPGILGYSVAAWTTIAVFYTQYMWGNTQTSEHISIGLYGFLSFILAFITQNISARLNSALSLASEQATSIRRLQRFSQQALMDMPDGIIACDQQHRILFLNHRAKQWFLLKEGEDLPDYLRNAAPQSILEHHGETLLIRQVKPHDSERDDYLLEIEDGARLAAEAQQIKLASLGRLTASIAHEVRNPLSALRQAAQLLAENEHIKEEDLYLTNVIEQQSLRINRIIEDVLQLSRRQQAKMETLRLEPWLKHFSEQFRDQHKKEHFHLHIECPPTLLIQFDADHFQQILHNLCSNALRYALAENPNNAQIFLNAQPSDELVELTIIDNGKGVKEEYIHNLFEPFYTSEHNGTGLGLYLCRELCEANNARIQYQHIATGACFKMLIQHL